MTSPYSLHGDSVFVDGHEELSRKQLDAAISRAMRRKMRLAGFDAEFQRKLSETGQATITWRYARYNSDGSVDWVTFEATQKRRENTFTLRCFGPRAAYAIERINNALMEGKPKRARRRFAEAQRQQVRSRKQERKRRRFAERQAKEPPQQVRKKRILPAPLSLKNKEHVVWQYQHSTISWKEAVASTIVIFDRHGDWKYSASQLAAKELFQSFDTSGWRFAQMKREGFIVRFDIVPDEWRWERFDEARFTVSCSKNNRDPRYRRLRQHFKPILTPLLGNQTYHWRRLRKAASPIAIAA